MTPQLFGLATSPWTAKAAFALDHAGVAYEFVEHTPMLGEQKLRRLAKTKKASVPLLVGDDGPVMGSYEIAKWADAQSKVQLFPAALRGEIDAWNARSERVLNAARRLHLAALLASPEAQKESLPKWVPGPLRGLMRFSARQGIEYLVKKYDLQAGGTEEDLAEATEVLEELRSALVAHPERGTILATFTFADIAMAVALNGFSPSPQEPLSAGMGPAVRAAWNRPKIGERFPDLYAWRDRVYVEHRQP